MAERVRPEDASPSEDTATAPSAGAGARPSQSVGRLFAAYTVLRIAVFVLTTVVLLVAGLRDVTLFVVAILLSTVISLVAFRSQRAQLAGAVEARAQETKRRQEAAAAEGREVEQLRQARKAEPGTQTPGSPTSGEPPA